MKPSIKKKNYDIKLFIYLCNLNMDRQVCVIKTVAYRARTDTHTAHGQTKSKIEGHKILSNDLLL